MFDPWSDGIFKNEYWFRVVSVPDMHETSRFWRRPKPPDPNPMSGAAAAKSRRTTPTVSEDDEKVSTSEDEKTSATVTTLFFWRKVHFRFGEIHRWILYWIKWALSKDRKEEQTRADLWFEHVLFHKLEFARWQIGQYSQGLAGVTHGVYTRQEAYNFRVPRSCDLLDSRYDC
jgi:hypothetical protein